MREFSFSDDDMDKARSMIQSGGCNNILFSEGTYQVEILDGQEIFWPFLQIDDGGKPRDSFCSCNAAEETGQCPHIAASAMQIFREHIKPLHVRFRTSIWNKLCIIASRRHGYETSALKKDDGHSLICQSGTGTPLFFIRYLKDQGEKILKEMIHERALETEETSLKFSNLSQEELTLWHEGTPSHKLRYELSFWSDLAKWMMLKQDNGDEYRIDFRMDITDLPKGVIITFEELRIGFYIAEVNWPEIIPALREVKSPIPIYEFQEIDIHKMIYDESSKSMTIDLVPIRDLSEKVSKTPPGSLSKLGYWRFHREIGFFPAHIDSLLKMNEIPKERIGTFLERHQKIVERFLMGTKIHHESIKASYTLHFDSQNGLCLSCYVFKPGDLQQENSAFFGPWVYLARKGFYRLEEILFNESETTIPQDAVGSFVEKHQLWLSDYEGFQTHVSNVESHVIYHLDDESALSFESESQFFDDAGGEVIDLGDWIYLKDRGFYHKLSGSGLTSLSPGLKVEKEKISEFIHQHKEELEQVKHFFADNSPLEHGGVHIYLNEDHQIVVDPKFVLCPIYKGREVGFFGDYVFVKNEGFSEIPIHCRLPEAYPETTVIEKKSEPYFITVELARLKPFTLKLDPKLKIPKSLVINVEKIQKGEENHWLLNLSYVSELGAENVSTFYEKLLANKSYALTESGLVFFKDPRFNWLRTLADDAIHKGDQTLSLSTLDWIRLSLFEEIIEPKGDDTDSVQSRELLEEIRSFQTGDKLNLRNFQSELRPYQKVGVDWLWFLYCHGLSGILCDDMGLGKTHQAMGLLAAVKNFLKTKRRKFIIICPTSVIYHWEDLLTRFLPKAKVHLFYGTQRTLINFRRDQEILLTTYGTMRSEKKALGKFNFEVAIYDELQFAKNIQSQTHRSLRTLKAKTRIGLSGTPIENNLHDLKALFDIILPTYFPSTALYREIFVNPIEKYQDQEKKMLLSKIIHPFILRRRKQDVLKDLPDKIEEISQCDLSDEQKKLYRDTYLRKRKPLMEEISGGKGGSPFIHVFSLLNQLKQICNHPALPLKDVDNYEKYESGKWNLFLELVRETRDSGQKLVVFSQYLDMLTIIEKYLTKEGIGFAAVRGSTINRREELERFRDDPDCEVFVASLKAVGVGVDLVSASVVIHYDRWWNPAKENQATDRVHRIGQNRGVQVFKLVTKGTIEEHIHHLIEKKKGLAEGIIGYDDQDQIKKLNRNELVDLFKKINKDLQNM